MQYFVLNIQMIERMNEFLLILNSWLHSLVCCYTLSPLINDGENNVAMMRKTLLNNEEPLPVIHSYEQNSSVVAMIIFKHF